jgi:sarcosine oxidase
LDLFGQGHGQEFNTESAELTEDIKKGKIAADMSTRYDVVVIGAGVFGAWTAWHLSRRGRRVLLADAYGPANARASSAGESRIIRMGYGADEVYTRWSQRSLAQWKEFFFRTRQELLFHETGVLWLAGQDGSRVQQTVETLRRCAVAFEELNRTELGKRYPQIGLDGITKGLLEPHSGVLMARRAVAAVVGDAIGGGVEYRVAKISEPHETGAISSVSTITGERIEAAEFVFACGAWLGKIFPDVLGTRIFPSRQEVFFFGVPAGDTRFAPPTLPTWLFQEDEIYGMPDLESRGLKIAVDRHGERVDPDTQSRLASAEGAEEARRFVEQRFPALRGAPIVEMRVCQYENTWNGDFLIDRHPEMENVWLVGGGSGHGFKHGPAVGEYVTARILDRAEGEKRFSLMGKETVQKRAVF